MTPNAELLRSLRHLVRGLSALFWGLPLALIIGVQTARTDTFHAFRLFPPVFAAGWLLFGLLEAGQFQKQQRGWRSALERAKLLAVINLGLAPFLYWWNQAPGELLFNQMVALLLLTAILFLSELNLALRRLAALLPDETLRADTNEFTAINRLLLFALVAMVAVAFGLGRLPALPPWVAIGLELLERRAAWLLMAFVLVPLAMTMALLWKIKTALLDSVFTPKE